MDAWVAEQIGVDAAEEVGAFFEACHAGDPTVRLLPADAFRAWAARAKPLLAVVRIEGRVVGFAYSTAAICGRDDRALHHFRFFVLPEARRRGIGSALLDWIASVPLDGPRPGLQSSCLDAWTAGLAFLERHGFSVSEEEVEMRREPGAVGESVIRAEAGSEEILLREFDATRDVEPWVETHLAAYTGDAMFNDLDVDGAHLQMKRLGFGMDVAECGGRLVGFCFSLAADEDGPGRIESLGVHPSVQRRGVGRALLRAGLRRLSGEQLPVVLDVLVQRRAFALYESEGFEVVSREFVYRRDL